MSTCGNIKTIAKRELAGYFSSPVPYIVLVIYLLLMGVFTFLFGGFFERQQASLEDSFFMWHPWLYLVLVPAVGMGLWAEERRLGTIELLLTFPITAWQAIVGKFIASWLFIGLALLLTFPVFITVNYFGSPDNGVIVATYLGSFLMAGSYLAIACMTSALTRSQVVSFILSISICLLLVLCGFRPLTDFFATKFSPGVVDTIASCSVLTHFLGFSKGVIDSRDVIFYLSLMVFCLFTTSVIIRNHRAG